MEYSYIYDYERDYNPTDTNDFFKYVVEYLVPYSSKLQTKLSDDEKKLTRQEKRLAEDYFKSDAFTSDKFSVIENYKNHMGGIIEEAFDNLFKEDGCYFISYDNDSFDSAYQSSIGGTPYVFYGSSYHDYSTVVHEFGHYTYDLLGNSLQSFDLCETHSQANEVLFLNYYINNQDISTNLKTYLRDYKIADFIESVILCSLVNETEKRCYNSENLKTGDLEKYLRKIYSENRSLMTAYDFDNALYYIAYVSMSSPCYYISYATSQLGSLNIEKLAYNDFDKAKDSYLKLFNYENCNTYREVYEYAGLYDPLSEDMFKYIVS